MRRVSGLVPMALLQRAARIADVSSSPVSATVHRPQAPPATRRLDRQVDIIGQPPGADVAYFSSAARALASEDAARSDSSTPVALYAPGVRFDGYA